MPCEFLIESIISGSKFTGKVFKRFMEKMEKMEKSTPYSTKTARKYNSPEVIKFGRVRELTTGGSSGVEKGTGTPGDAKKMG